MLVALGLIFFGLEIMSGAFKPLRSDESFMNLMLTLDAQSVLSILGCVAIGCMMTMIIQSSSAMLGITIALAATGDEFTSYGIFVVQKIDKIATEFYLGARNHELDRVGQNFDDVFAVLGGARIKF